MKLVKLKEKGLEKQGMSRVIVFCGISTSQIKRDNFSLNLPTGVGGFRLRP